MAKIKYIEKNFRDKSLILIAKINAVITEYEKQGYSLTLRQVYYQMVARDIIQNNDRSYKNLGALINDARLAGLIDWSSIEDRTRNLQRRSKWDNPGEIIDSAASSYHIDCCSPLMKFYRVFKECEGLELKDCIPQLILSFDYIQDGDVTWLHVTENGTQWY